MKSLKVDKTKYQNLPYPRTYKLSGGWKFMLYLLAAFAFFGGLLCIVLGIMEQNKSSPAMIGLGSLFTLSSIYIIMDTIKSKVILYKDKIEIHDMLPMRQIHRFDIQGYRITEESHVETLVLIPHDINKKKRKIHLTIQTDESFYAWFSPLDNLDQREANQELEDIKHEVFQGQSSDQVINKLGHSAKHARNFNIAAVICTAIAFFFPNIYTLTIAVLFPLMAIAITAKYNGVFVLLKHTTSDIHPGFDLGFLMPSVVLFLRALLDVNILDWQKLFIFCILGGVFLAIICVQADKSILKQRKYAVIGILAIMIVYSYATISIYNKALDKSYPQTYETTILSKYMTSARISQPELKLSPWGTQTEKTRASISKEFYNSVKKGDVICVKLYTGAFSVPWFDIKKCPEFGPNI